MINKIYIAILLIVSASSFAETPFNFFIENGRTDIPMTSDDLRTIIVGNVIGRSCTADNGANLIIKINDNIAFLDEMYIGGVSTPNKHRDKTGEIKKLCIRSAKFKSHEQSIKIGTLTGISLTRR